MEKVMIERQREVTGNYNYGDEDNAKVEDVGLEADDESEEKPIKTINKKVGLLSRGRRKKPNTKNNIKDKEDTTERNELKNGKKKLRKRGGKGSRFN